jgi:hypothetical protein
MKKTLDEFKNVLPKGFTYISGFDNGMQSKVKIKNNVTGKIHNIKAENYIYLNPESNRVSEKMIIEECNKRNFSFIKREKNKITIQRDNINYEIYLSNFMRGMDPKEIGIEKRNQSKIENSKKNYKEKSKRDDIQDYDIIEFAGMKKPMKIKHIPTQTEWDIPNPQIFSNGGYREFPWDIERSRIKLEDDFVTKFNDIKDRDSYELVENLKYINNKTKISVIHKECNTEFMVRPDFFLNQGTRCPHCALKGKSGKEIEVLDYIKSIYSGEVIHTFKLDNTEIDIFIPDLNVGIEYNGLYWHSEQNGKDKNYHINKTNKMLESGYRLIHIFEDEWINKQDIVKSKLNHILGLNNGERIYARKSQVQVIDSKTKNTFLENNHIQGSDLSSISLGLFYEKELVSVMTFSKPRGGIGKNTGKDGYYELVRFASLKDKVVVGAFGKLLEYFKKNYVFKKIITYADLRWSVDSNIYEKIGFKNVRTTTPNYWYADRNYRYHRYGFRKQVLKDKFPELYDSSLTEFEIMNQSNYYRIWDCGNLVYELNVT